MIRVKFHNGSVVDYHGSQGVSQSADGALTFINDVAGNVIATLATADIESTEPVAA